VEAEYTPQIDIQRAIVCDLRKRIVELQQALIEETKIVDRIWDLFGRPTYKELAGRSIYDLISSLQAELAEERARLENLRKKALARCDERNWSKRWIHRLAYLILEASELAEAIRGKRGDIVTEAADAMICLLCLIPESVELEPVIAEAERQLTSAYSGEHEEVEVTAIAAAGEGV